MLKTTNGNTEQGDGFAITEYPIFAQKDIGMPRKKLFVELRDVFLARNDGAMIRDIANILEQPPQTIAAWASSNTRRSPPWWAIMRLCHHLKYEITIRPNEVIVSTSDAGLGI